MSASFHHNQTCLILLNKIRDQLPENSKSKIQVNDPTSMMKLLDIYNHSNSTELKFLITQLFENTGSSWSKLLTLSHQKRPSSVKAEKIKMTDKAKKVEIPEKVETPEKALKKVRMYRGAAVVDQQMDPIEDKDHTKTDNEDCTDNTKKPSIYRGIEIKN